MRLRALLVAALSAMLLAGCGGEVVDGTATHASSAPSTATPSAPTGPELASRAADVLEEAGSVRIQGALRAQGKDVSLDLGLNGQDMTGSVTLDGQQVQVSVVGGAGYVHASAAYWISQGMPRATASKVAPKWVRVPQAAASELANVSLGELVDELRNPAGFTFDDHVDSGQLDGHSVWQLTDSEGTTTTIAAEGPPYPLEVGMSGEGTLTLSEFGAVPPIAAPTDVLDLSGQPA